MDLTRVDIYWARSFCCFNPAVSATFSALYYKIPLFTELRA